MRALIQRVSQAGVSVEGAPRDTIGEGLVVLLGVGRGDSSETVSYIVEKVVNLRIFSDDEGRMNRSLLDVQGEALVISQFTLYGHTRRGRRPGFTDAAPPDEAVPLYEEFVTRMRSHGITVRTGEFGAHMDVEIHNNGPVTLMVESPGDVTQGATGA